MSTKSKFLWFLAPVTLVVTAWYLAARLTSPATDRAANSNADFLLVAGSLLFATVVSYAGLAHSKRPHTMKSDRGRQRTDLLRVVQSLPLSSREWIHAVKFQSKLILIGTCDGRMTRLDDASDSRHAVGDADVPEPAFSEEGVDLRDTQHPSDAPSAEYRNLESASRERSVSRAALNAANLSDFKSKLADARGG